MSINRRGFLARGAAAAATLATLEPTAILAAPARGRIDPAGRFGSLLNRAEFDGAPRALSPAVLARLASQIIMRGIVGSGPDRRHVLSGLPPVMMQGTPSSLGYPGSCEAQSFGYGLGTYTSAHGFPGFNAAGGAADRISAAWLFEWAQRNQHNTNCDGSLALPYLNFLVAKGAPSASQVPYQPSCSYIDGLSSNIHDYSGVGKFAIGSYKALPNFLHGRSSYVSQFKQYINAGHAIAFSGVVARGYDNPATAMVNGAYDPQNFISGSGHGQMIVGYDDSLGHSGAFLVQNSFGTACPYLNAAQPLMHGRLWWTYEAFFASQGFGAIAYSIPPRVAFPVGTVTLTASNPGAPVVRILEAIRADDNGESLAVLEADCGQPVQLNTVSVTPPGSSSATLAELRPYRELHAHTLSDAGTPNQVVTYRGHVTIR